MSEHVIEDLVADSVRVLDGHPETGDPRVRDWFAVLYGFESGFDCSFTRFRVLDFPSAAGTRTGSRSTGTPTTPSGPPTSTH
ncbi:MAG TPA: hypothetical protein VFV67_29200 [Actinophytocola sp.]|uniref:hypothetical protein n=1 Tax=Actinophytocola sp. TaxID=1872138 RepID=UPI002DB9C8D7|nr:hypothetical protein [Actinophytocola sp.]HEU5474742.1 hypothetical protein [Actinophytocola sp.]